MLMVLVDLSKRGMSMKVTDELNIMQVLLLLLNPDGIMLKNELYFEVLSNIFEHTIQVHYLPVICSQALSLRNNHIDSKNLYLTLPNHSR